VLNIRTPVLHGYITTSQITMVTMLQTDVGSKQYKNKYLSCASNRK